MKSKTAKRKEKRTINKISGISNVVGGNVRKFRWA
jgi:hypothetical protein